MTLHGLVLTAQVSFGPDAGVNLCSTLKNAGIKNNVETLVK
jgi:hypothetical protein